jgi:hypothetical protein
VHGAKVYNIVIVIYLDGAEHVRRWRLVSAPPQPYVNWVPIWDVIMIMLMIMLMLMLMIMLMIMIVIMIMITIMIIITSANLCTVQTFAIS